MSPLSSQHFCKANDFPNWVGKPLPLDPIARPTFSTTYGMKLTNLATAWGKTSAWRFLILIPERKTFPD